MKKVIIVLLALVCLVTGLVAIREGFDKKEHYYNNSYSSVNAYVGGDAYNYIINAGYFAGYMALGGSLIITSAILLVINEKLQN